MNKALGQMIRGALILGTVLLSAQAGLAQVAGRVTTGDGTAINGATVEIWDAYPGGAVLTSGNTNASGEFAFGAVAGDIFDLRVYKIGCYPTVVRDLPDPTTNALVVLVPRPVPAWSSQFMNFWDDNSTFLGVAMQVGDVVEVRDPRGYVCGATNSPALSMYSVNVYEDNPLTPGLDGPTTNEALSMTINGLAATPDSTPKFLGSHQIAPHFHLMGSTAAPGVTMTGELERPGQAGKVAIIPAVVTNTGSLTAHVTVDAELDQPWSFTIELAPGKTLPLTLTPGQSEDVVVKIDVPNGTPDQDVEVRVHVQSDDYGPANSGAWTMLAVTTISDIGGGGSGLVPDQFSLAQNYPNPFNPATEIAYSLRVDGMVRLDVINLLGQNVRTLVDGYRSRGTHSEYWDGRDHNGATVPSGIYFYRLTQKAESLIRKMVLLK